MCLGNRILKKSNPVRSGRENSVLEDERLVIPGVGVLRAFSSWPDDLWVARGLWVLQLRTGDRVPLRLLSPPPSPRPVRRRTCIIESAFQYLFTLLLQWVAITVYIICLSVLPGSCSLQAEWFEEGEGEKEGETLILCCHLQ